MTRFARAKGSKSSNERVPEEATSWQVMKQQLEEKKQEGLDAKKRQEFETIRKANYKAFLDERENNVTTEWTEFEDSSVNHNKSTSTKKKKKTAKPEIKSEPKLQELISEIEKVLDNEDSVNENKSDKIRKKIKNKKNTPEQSNAVAGEDDDAPEESSAKIAPNQNKIKVKLPKKVPLIIPSINKSNNNDTNDVILPENNGLLSHVSDKKPLKRDKNKKKSKMNNADHNSDGESQENKIGESSEGRNKRTKNKSKTKHDESNPSGENEKKQTKDLSEDQLKRITKKKEKRMRQLENRKKFKAEEREKALKEEENQNMKKRKLPKERDDKEHKRRKPDSQITKMNINGVDIEIDYFDGFPVKREDAERLHKLRKEMISKSIPRNEVQIALKLERRKAEKALTREKKRVCFNCRKSGHVLSECPDLNENSSHEMIGSGICFKCGSTEHTHFECRVVRNDSFKFATCFICREQGHISRQCPDNERGLYPKGGACKVCGDVTHLKKDCPKFQAEQESQTITLDTFEFNNVESLSGETEKPVAVHTKINSKVIKF